MACVWRERLRERLIRRDLPDHRREPVLECKGLAPIASEETAVGGGFEETEVDPGDEESELDEHKGGGAEEDDEDVGDEEVDAGEGLWRSTRQKPWKDKMERPTLTRSLILPRSCT